MHILFVSQYFWPENFRVNDLVSGLIERGYTVKVLTGIPNYPEGRFFAGYGIFRNTSQEYYGAKIVRVPLVPRGKGGAGRLMLNYISFAFFSCILAPFLCYEKFDLIFVCQLSPVTVGLPALLLKKLKKVPILLWVLDLWPESLSATGAVRSTKVLGVVDRLVRFIYHGCDKIVVSSKGFIPSVASKGVGLDNLGYFPNWYEPEYNTKQPEKAALPHGFRIMFAGNIGAAQDFDTIIATAEKLKGYSEIHWVILGDGRKSEWVMKQVTLRGLTNTFHLMGRYPPEAMAGFFSQADVMLVTLKRDPIFSLTVPGKIQSYMACGRPIVAALDGEGGHLVAESGAGLSVPSEDPDALAEAVLTMYRMSKEERDAMGISGKKYCEANFDREMLIDRLEGWMRDLTAG